MAEALVDGTGSGYYVAVTPENELKVSSVTSGTSVISGTTLDDWTLRYKMLIDYAGGYNPIYLGLSEPGTNTGSASWMIRKNVYDANSLMVSGLFGSGNRNFDKTWNDRSGTGEAYS